jgi:cystinosin
VIRAQYAARHHDLEPTVRFNDVAFAAHALLLSLLVTSQYSRLWGFVSPPSSSQPSRLTLGIACGCAAGVAAVVTMVLAAPGRGLAAGGGEGGWMWLDAVYAVSYVKLIVTLVKYTPQVVANYRNGSTKGWSIVQILLDFTGGLLSIAQLAIDSYLQHDWAGITGNPVKFALGNVSIVYDLVFMTQHYVLYRGADGKAEEADALLGGRGDEERRID